MLRHACGYKLASEDQNTRAIQQYLGDDALVERIHQHLAQRICVSEVPERQARRERKLMEISRLLDELRDDE